MLRLVHAAGQYPVYWPDAPRAWLSAAEVVDAWVAESRGELVGHVAICEVGHDPVAALRWREITGRSTTALAGVSRLFVRPRATGQGIGSALLDVAVREIRARGLLPVLEVVSASRDAIRLYDARGWRLAGIYDWGRSGDRLRTLYYLAPVDATGS
jgi:GNAT superfamily N-acetyltransferase